MSDSLIVEMAGLLEMIGGIFTNANGKAAKVIKKH